MSDRSLKLSVAFEAIDKLGGTIKRLSGGAKGLGRDFKKLQSDTKALSRTQANAAKAMALSATIKENHAELDKMRRKMRDVAAEIAASTNPTKALRNELRDLQKQEKYLSDTTKKRSGELAGYQNDLQRAGVDVRHLATEERRLSTELKQSSDLLARKGKQLKRVHALQANASKVAVGSGIAGGTMSAGVTAPLVFFGREAMQAAMDAEELQSAFNVTFGSMASDMNSWADKTGNALGRSTQEMQAFSNTFGMYFNKVTDPAKAAALSKRFAILAQDLSSFFNTRPEEAGAAIQSGLSGESEPLRRYGVFLTEAKVKAMGLKMGIANLKGEMSEESKIMARQAIIWQETTKAQGDVLRTSDSATNRLRASNAQWQELQVTVGQKLIPQLTPLIAIFERLLNGFNQLPPGMQTFIIGGAAILAVIGPILLGIAVLAGAVSFLSGPIIAVGGVLGAITAPIWGAVAVVAALAAAIYIYWTPITNFVSGLWGRITGFFRENWTTIRNVMLGALVIFAPFIAAIVYVASLVYRNFDAIKAAIWSIVTKVAGIVQPFMQPFLNIIGSLAGLAGKFWNIGVNIVQGLINGIVSMSGSVIKAIVNLAAQVGGKFAKLLGINSPSRVFMNMGGHITDGLRMGIDGNRNGPARAAGRMAAGVLAAGSMAMAPAGAAGRGGGGAGRAGGDTYNITLQIQQQPGEDAEALARRVMEKIEQLKARKARSSYDDR